MGEFNENKNLALGNVFPSILGSLMQKASTSDRAANVTAALVSMGFSSTRLTSEGYGSQHPVHQMILKKEELKTAELL